MDKYLKLLNETFSKLIEEDEKDSPLLTTDEPEGDLLTAVDLKDYTQGGTKVVSDGDWEVWKPKSEEGMIILSQGTKWLSGYSWSSGEKDYDEISSESWDLKNWNRAYILINKNKTDRSTGLPKKYLFQSGWGGLYSPSFARYSFASWLIKEDLKKLIKYFGDLKLPYVSRRLQAETNKDKVQKSGGVYTYPTDGEINWRDRTQVTSIVIVPGTKRINSYAFSGFSSVKEINIPESVTSLGKNVFGHCDSLEKINLPSGIKTIPSYTFNNCTSLSSFIVKDSVREIHYGAFAQCTNLKTLYIPSSVTKVEESIFDSWGDKLPANLTVYCQAPEKPNGWHENWNVSRRSYNRELNTHEEKKAEIIWGASKPSINEEIDNQIDLEAIENVTFTLTGGVTERDLLEEEKEFITKVVLDDTVKSIPNGMFAGCKNLKEIVFNDKVEFIGTRAFADCFSLQEVTIPASIDFISSGAFHSCKLLETVKSYSEFPDAPNFQPLGIFNGCYGITLHVKSQEMKERWEAYLSRKGNDDSITEIIVMDETEKKTKVTEDVEPEETLLSTISDRKVLLDTPKWKVVRVLSPEAYAEFIKKGNAPIEGRLNHILSAGAEEFYNRTKGVALYILIDKQSDDRYLFAPKMYAYTVMGYDDYNKNIMDFLRNIGTDEALQNWFKRTFTATTRNIQKLQDTQAEVTKRKYAYVYPDDEPIDKRDVAEQIKIVTITEGTTEIEDYAFDNFKGVKEIIIPKSVKKIGRYAFASCNSLISIVIPEGVTKIEENTFWGCHRLEKVTLSNTITEIGDSAFWSCDKLWEINIPRSVTKIGDAAFLGCHILSELFIPASVQTIGVQALEIRNSYYNTIGYGKATIYCEAQSKPAGWHKNWTTSEVEVVWGAKPGLKEDVMNESTNYKLVQLNKSDKHMPEIIKAASDEWGSASKYFTELSDRRIAFKLMDGENIVGFFSIVFDDDTTGEGNIVPWLEKMYTFSQYRKMGVGTIMQKEAEGIAKRKGYDKMFLWTDLNNYYEKTGWKFETDWTGEQGKKVNLYSKDLNKLPETMVGYMVF